MDKLGCPWNGTADRAANKCTRVLRGAPDALVARGTGVVPRQRIHVPGFAEGGIEGIGELS